MFHENVMERFLDLYPIRDYGRIWNSVKTRAPTRLAGDTAGNPSIAWVAMTKQDHVQPDLTGMLYKTPHGKVIYWPMSADGAAKDIVEARYVLDSAVFEQAIEGWIHHDWLGTLGGIVSGEDRQLFRKTIYGDLQSHKLLKLHAVQADIDMA